VSSQFDGWSIAEQAMFSYHQPVFEPRYRGFGHLAKERKVRLFEVSRARRTSGAVLVVIGCLLFLAEQNLASPRSASSKRQSTDPAKETQPDLKTFVGTWRATFNGEVLAILVLKEQRGTLIGTLNNFDISVDKEGDLIEPTHKDQGDAPLLNARFRSGALLFVVMQKDQYAPSTEWKFVPKSEDEGELTPVLDHQVNAPKDMIVKPIRMVREHAMP
jgi:hypothetical protein